MLKKIVFSFFLFSFFWTISFCFSDDFLVWKPDLEIVPFGNNILIRDLSTWNIEKREIYFDKYIEKENKIIYYDEENIKEHLLMLWKYFTWWKHGLQVVNYITDEVFTWNFEISLPSYDHFFPLNDNIKLVTIPMVQKRWEDSFIWGAKKYQHQIGFFVQEIWWIPFKNGFIDTDIVIDSDGDGVSDNDQDILFNQPILWQYDHSLSEIFWKIVYYSSWEQKNHFFTIDFENFNLFLTERENMLYQEISTLIKHLSNENSLQYQLKIQLDLLRRSLKDQKTINTILSEWLKNKDHMIFFLTQEDVLLFQSILQDCSVPHSPTIEVIWEEESFISSIDVIENSENSYGILKESLLNALSEEWRKVLTIKFNTFELIENNLSSEKKYQEFMQLMIFVSKHFEQWWIISQKEQQDILSQLCRLSSFFDLQIADCSFTYLQQWDFEHQEDVSFWALNDENLFSWNVSSGENWTLVVQNQKISSFYFMRLILSVAFLVWFLCLWWLFYKKK